MSFEFSFLETTCLREVYYGLGLPDSLSRIQSLQHSISFTVTHLVCIFLCLPHRACHDNAQLLSSAVSVLFSLLHHEPNFLFGRIIHRRFFQKDARRSQKRKIFRRPHYPQPQPPNIPASGTPPTTVRYQGARVLYSACCSLDPRVFTLKGTNPNHTLHRCSSGLTLLRPIHHPSQPGSLFIVKMPRGAYDVSATNNPRPKPNPK